MTTKKVYHRQKDLTDPNSEYLDMVELADYMKARAEIAGIQRRIQVAYEGLKDYKETGQGLVKTEQMLKEVLGI